MDNVMPEMVLGINKRVNMNSLIQFIGLEILNENVCVQAAYFSFKVRKQ